MARTISTSANLVTVPNKNTTVGTFVSLTPASFASWSACFTAHPPSAGFQYQLTDGDYRSWGRAQITNAVGAGTSGNPVMIRYSGTHEATHPVTRRSQGLGEAIIDAIQINGSAVGYWHFHGLTQREPGFDTDVVTATSGIVFDWMLIEDSSRSYGIRLRSGTNHTIQRCVIRNSAGFGTGAGDIGINIVPQSAPVTGIKILDCEIYNWGDSFQASDNASDMYMATSGLVEGCDFYLTSARYNPDGTALAENAMDFKSGNDSVQWVVRDCRMWGFRSGAESQGELVTLHNGARNILFDQCTFADAPYGLHMVAWDADDLPPGGLGQQTPRNVVVTDGWFKDIQNYNGAGDGAGAAWRTINNEHFEGCVIAGCDAIEYIHNTIVHAGGPTYSSNIRVEPTLEHHVDSQMLIYDDDTDDNSVLPESGSWDTYQRKRWTGIETVDGPIPFSSSRASHRGKSTITSTTGSVSHRKDL